MDGGAVANNLMVQFLSDILAVPVSRPVVPETTALGSAFLAGLAVGYWNSLDQLRKTRKIDRTFKPKMKSAERKKLYAGWQEAVKRAKNWAKD